MYTQLPKQKHPLRTTIIVLVSLIVLGVVGLYVYDVVRISNTIRSGEYGLEQFGSAISGAGGANIDDTSNFALVTDDDPSLGPLDAPVVIVEFADFECPFCKQAFPIIRGLAHQYPDAIRHVYRDFPLDDIHPNATIAAYAGHCAHAQNRFWELHDKLFQNQENLERQNILLYAQQVGINVQTFSTCLDAQTTHNEVAQDVLDGLEAGVLGTPTWFINGVRVAGVLPEKVLQQIVEDTLARKK